MSFPATIDNLLNHKVKENFNIKLFKKSAVSHEKQENILQKLIFIDTFEEISTWVESATKGQRYIACPANTSREDRNSCFNHLQELLVQAIQGINKRRDGRDLKLVKASETDDYYAIASILASAAWSYWQNYHLFIDGDTAFYANNHQKNQQRIDLQKAQIEHIGAAVSFQKAHKKGSLQEIFDFYETEEILKNENFED